MELTHEDNIQTAADPQAIQTSPPMKLPIYDNDPTRDVSPPQEAGSKALLVLAVLAAIALVIAAVLALAQR